MLRILRIASARNVDPAARPELDWRARRVQPFNVPRAVACAAETRRLDTRHDARPVLLVEDDEAIRESLSELLESEGYRVVTARNGQVAMEWLESSSESPGVMLLDLMMPVMSGLEVLDAMRRLGDAERRDVPVIVLTASRDRSEAKGVVANLRKPIDVDELLDTIARVFAA